MKLNSRRSAIVASTAAVALLGAAAALAQVLPRTPAEFDQQVGITAAQKAKIQAVRSKYKPRADAIGEKYKPQFVALQRQMQDLNAKYRADIKPIMDQQEAESLAILSPAQREKIKKIQAALQAEQLSRMSAQAPPAAATKK